VVVIRRIGNDPETEIDTALAQVFRITWLRLERAFGKCA